MAMRSSIRSASRATRSRPSLSSRLPGRPHPAAPFASIHTTPQNTQEAAAAAAPTEDSSDALSPYAANKAAKAATIDTILSQTPKTFPELQEYLSAWRHKADALKRQIHHREVRFRNSLRYEILPGGQRVRISRPFNGKNKPVKLDAVFLRDRCPCPQCVSPSSGNKSFSSGEIPTSIRFESFEEQADGSLHVRWANDIPRFRSRPEPHVTVFPGVGQESINQLLKEKPHPFAPLKVPLRVAPYRRKLWNREQIAERLQKIPYDEFMAGGWEFRRVVRELGVNGLVFITDVPATETAVADIALKFGAIKETFYGRTWDVRSKPDAENVAYTSSYLGLHSDMLYLESPPRIQLLHCLKNSCSGGESIFSDAFHVAEELRSMKELKAELEAEEARKAAGDSLLFRRINSPHVEEKPEDTFTSPVSRKDPPSHREILQKAHAFDALTRRLVPYHYSKNGFQYRQARPVFDFSDPNPDVHEVWWSPPFQAPFSFAKDGVEQAEFRAWHMAARVFQNALETEENMFQYRLRPGECVLFDNRRVLHGRREFDAGSGLRWLKGTYVANEDFISTSNKVFDEEHHYLRRLEREDPNYWCLRTPSPDEQEQGQEQEQEEQGQQKPEDNLRSENSPGVDDFFDALNGKLNKPAGPKPTFKKF
ncbi:hypothetical protein CkaCkLH20_05325 [Colletotrichum karsti]|uniref:Gamma-butyrobetaine dioxygenase n=1 Tax=Colletotrichum karsti TaxID=1095194 RepID=A0A9P6I6U1_9PEZI|nr:uncharacterized protein CkaCkLH20_05325 [Colletotrichum karsti]KAF9877059.1 hypothetical protein CkaCkLH20_05325 [Colletotrichum karsti]